MVGYIRVSDESQVDGYSLDAQRREIRRWCESKGYELTDVYADEGVSAHTDNINKRPAMVKLLADAEKNLFDGVVVHTLDRWARNLGVQRQVMTQLGKCHIGFVSVTEDFDYTTPAGHLLLSMLGSTAEFFSDQLGVHVMKAQRQLAETGMPIGPVPFGYLRQDDKKQPPVVVQEEASAVKEAFQLRAEGSSYGGIAARFNSRGLSTRGHHRFTAHAVKGMLNNRFYCGYIKYKDQEYQGRHESVISEELFQRVQAKRYHRMVTRSVHGPRGILQGMATCVRCGHSLQSDRHRLQFPMYRERHAHECTTNNRSIIAEEIDGQIAAIFHSLNLASDWQQKMAALAVKDYHGLSPEALKDKRQRICRAYADGGYSFEEYNRRLDEINRQMREASGMTQLAYTEAIELFKNITVLWQEATTEERRRLVGSLIETAFVDLEEKRVAAISPTPAFRTLIGEAIDITPGASIQLIPVEKQGNVGVGGDGGESNSPSNENLPRYTTG